MKIKREEMVKELVNDDIEDIIQWVNNRDFTWLRDILTGGWVGYNELNDDALEREYRSRNEDLK